MSAQKPMSARMQEVMEILHKRGEIRVDRVDKRVLKRLIKKGWVKIDNPGWSEYFRQSIAVVVPTVPVTPTEKKDTGGPWAKRRKALEESGLPYRGKTWGKKRVDLPREERERKIKEEKESKANMWHKLGGRKD